MSDLDAPIGADEVLAAIKALLADRAPRPDGFTANFYKACWPIIQVELMEAVHAFATGNTRHFDKINGALVVLLPKKIGASTPGDFRPITMIHSFAKLVSKILALRLAPKLKLLIDKIKTPSSSRGPFMTITNMYSVQQF